MPTPTLPERCPACDSDLPNEPSLCLNTNHPPGTPHVLCDNPFHAPMPTPPLPSRDDEPMTPPDVEPVVLWRWHPAYFIWRKNDPKASHAVEYRALPVAAYNALLARANTAKVAADLMRDRAEKAEREHDALRGALIDLEQHARDVTEETGNTSHPTPPGKFYVPIVETHRLELAIDRAREAIGLPRLES